MHKALAMTLVIENCLFNTQFYVRFWEYNTPINASTHRLCRIKWNMVDITSKHNSYRTACARAVVEASRAETIDTVKQKAVPKGDVLEAGRIAAMFAIKQTASVIPHCHPLAVEYANVDYAIGRTEITITVEVRAVSKTGVEVEAMHGAAVAALTLYDMLKPIDKGLKISAIELVSKKGGKSDYANSYPKYLKAAVIVCSDSISAGKGSDRSGKLIEQTLAGYGLEVRPPVVIPDEAAKIREEVMSLCGSNDMIVLTGGTGLSPRDVTPETIRPLLDREIPGIMETARHYGSDRMPFSMLSRSVAGFRGDTLILTLPGSASGARDYMNALFPQVIHAFNIVKGVLH